MRSFQIEAHERIEQIGAVQVKIKSAIVTLKEAGSYYSGQTIMGVSLKTAHEIAALWMVTEPKPIEVSELDEPNQMESLTQEAGQ